jgi:hypothetical protein
MKTREASRIVQLALDHATSLHTAKLSEIAAAARVADGVGEEWLLDPVEGVWVQPDAAPAASKLSEGDA